MCTCMQKATHAVFQVPLHARICAETSSPFFARFPDDRGFSSLSWSSFDYLIGRSMLRLQCLTSQMTVSGSAKNSTVLLGHERKKSGKVLGPAQAPEPF